MFRQFKGFDAYFCVLLLVLGGCSNSTTRYSSAMPLTATPAAWPAKVVPANSISRALSCVRGTGALKDTVFAVGPWVDSTGKHNAVAFGATGAFLPQAGTASLVTDALRQAGGQVLVQYFGAAEVRVPANYVINGIFNSLDFGTHLNADVRVNGIGPLVQGGWAQLTLTVQMDDAKTRINRQTAVLTRAVRYTQIGATAGKVWHDNNLVTGAIQLQDQQRLQFEAVHGPIAIAVIDVIAKEFPVVSHCWDKLVAQQEALQATEQ